MRTGHVHRSTGHTAPVMSAPVADWDAARSFYGDPLELLTIDVIADLLHRPAWHADALCREYPDVNFFPTRGEDTGPAKTVCATCLVRAECLAATDSLTHGVWGGTSMVERRGLHTRDR